MAWWIWVLVGFALLVIEFASTTMHIGFFAAGAFLVALAVALGWNSSLSAQIIAFTVTSLLALVVFRPIVMRKLKLRGDGHEVDAIVGQQAIAMDEIASGAIGQAELRGSTWSARNVGASSITKGQRCAVEKVDGLQLHIRG
ncbi:MAG: NfeD family protein [Thermoanaerobaculia bacterium]|nr:NfeD family protein [Thermoanaerobaculia bacterium]